MSQAKAREPDVASTSKLSNAVVDAQILLAYAAQKGIDIQDRVTRTIVGTARLVRENKVIDEQESAFWGALNSLARSVSPVSVSCLRATMDSHRKGPDRIFGIDIGRSSPARWAVRSYT